MHVVLGRCQKTITLLRQCANAVRTLLQKIDTLLKKHGWDWHRKQSHQPRRSLKVAFYNTNRYNKRVNNLENRLNERH